MNARTSWRRIRQVKFEPSISSDELLSRYIRSKLDSRRYLAGDSSLMVGFNLLVAAFGVINVLARARAASAGRSFCSDEDIRMAVEAADRLVIEHPALYQSKFHRVLSQAALGSASLCGGLLTLLHL
jgi:hypothetical protein